MENLLVLLSQKLDLASGFAFVIVFLSGVLVSFTPCVYPLLPVIIGFIGARAGGLRLKGFLLSLFYVFGMSIVYSLLGAFASLSGKVFGALTSTPLVYFIVGNIFLLFGLSMLGLFNMPVPRALSRFDIKKGVYVQALFLGAFSGLVVGPCVAPVLGSLLVYVGTKQNVLYGMLLLFTFAFGLGVIIILTGTFASLLVTLPKSGLWMERVKKICGFILILAAEYFLIKMGGL